MCMFGLMWLVLNVSNWWNFVALVWYWGYGSCWENWEYLCWIMPMMNALFINIDVKMIKYELYTMCAVEIIYEWCCMVCMGLVGVTLSVGNLDSTWNCCALPGSTMITARRHRKGRKHVDLFRVGFLNVVNWTYGMENCVSNYGAWE